MSGRTTAPLEDILGCLAVLSDITRELVGAAEMAGLLNQTRAKNIAFGYKLIDPILRPPLDAQPATPALQEDAGVTISVEAIVEDEGTVSCVWPDGCGCGTCSFVDRLFADQKRRAQEPAG